MKNAPKPMKVRGDLPKLPSARKCAFKDCGQKFIPLGSAGGGRKPSYCSYKCQRDNDRAASVLRSRARRAAAKQEQRAA